ncbi:FdhD protein [Rhizobiales bacterium GAS191]|jgi:FdhD protein|nr:FdhD protein [Rhizobiales bacterium GAS113]SEB82359.1 FdhD protein [Rhizobiales bacterium GAS188]SED45318.1 FdhD protein [Rhizobiales bacterium GAS191]
MANPICRVDRLAWRHAGPSVGERALPEETAIAFTYNGTSYAVMMATPRDLEDFAIGFSLTEGIVDTPDEIETLEIVEEEVGIELRMWLSASRATSFQARRRHMAGPTGCGLCGIETLTQAMRPLPQVSEGPHFSPAEIMEAVSSLAPSQLINLETRAVHAAGFWSGERGLVALREDVGRHNALDKLGGAMARSGLSGGDGIAILTSRISVEMVQKAAMIGIPLLVAVSAPTALAVRTAEACNITLIGIARGDGFEIFTHAHRVALEAEMHVA